MVQLNTKVLHHGMPFQISQTFPEWLNGEGWSEQALAFSMLREELGEGKFLNPLTVSLRQEISES